MSQSDALRSELGNMRYFTPKLVLQLNSSDGGTVDDAMEQWEKAIVAYKRSLRKTRREMPLQSRPITDLSLHDWDLLNLTVQDVAGLAGAIPTAFIVLKHDDDFVIICYSLSQKIQFIESPEEWSLSRERVHWLYDEVGAIGNDQEPFVHRILLSDGTTVLVPFSNCRVVQVKSDHAMSHSDLMQIA